MPIIQIFDLTILNSPCLSCIRILPPAVIVFLSLAVQTSGKAQFSVSAQLRTRTELRDGYGNPVKQGSKTGAFTSQRTRVSFHYPLELIQFKASFQDIRVWGQDASTISNADGSRLMLHEGWAEIRLNPLRDSLRKTGRSINASLKIGRQELNYDDARLIGNLDWLQQGRRHDMAVVKFRNSRWLLESGHAFNQNSDATGISGTSYLPGNLPMYIKNSNGVIVPIPAGMVPLTTMGNISSNSIRSGSPAYANSSGTNSPSQDYKSFSHLYLLYKSPASSYSFLFFNDRFGKYKLDSVQVNGGYVYGRRFVKSTPADPFEYSGMTNRFTYGVMISRDLATLNQAGKFNIQIAAYHQSGRDRDRLALNAYHYSLIASVQNKSLGYSLGYEVLSGNKMSTPVTKNHRFDPLYGTPHRHWGYMDYFYTGTGSPTGGLKDLYLKLRWGKEKKRWRSGLDIHTFFLQHKSPDAEGVAINNYLGTELDWISNYSINPFTSVEIGLAGFFNSPSAQFAKNLAEGPYKSLARWAYIQINVRPEIIIKD